MHSRVRVALLSIFFLAGTTIASTMVSAGTITFYIDTADFLRALQPLEPVAIGGYSGNVIENIIYTTAQTHADGSCCTILGTSSMVVAGQFNNLSWQFGQLGNKVDADCFNIPNCIVTAPTEMILTLNPNIEAFYSLNATLNNNVFVGVVNGVGLPPDTATGFFGAIGPSISSLDFTNASSVLTDNVGTISLSGIIVAQAVNVADEPSELACFVAAIFIVGARFWRSSAR